MAKALDAVAGIEFDRTIICGTGIKPYRTGASSARKGRLLLSEGGTERSESL
jgi:hypothetical protein